MTESEWLACDDPGALLRWAEDDDPGADRKMRLLCCAYCRGMWPLLTDARSRRAVAAAERFADLPAGRQRRTLRTLRRAFDEAVSAGLDLRGVAQIAAATAAHCCQQPLIPQGNLTQAERNVPYLPARAQAGLVRDVFGPFRQTAFDPAWRTPDVLSLAAAAYEEREHWVPDEENPGWKRLVDDGTLDPFRLALVADALEEAGCDNEDILRHLRGWVACPICHGGGWLIDRVPARKCHNCRGGGVVRDLANLPKHVRGCWAIDRILGKE